MTIGNLYETYKTYKFIVCYVFLLVVAIFSYVFLYLFRCSYGRTVVTVSGSRLKSRPAMQFNMRLLSAAAVASKDSRPPPPAAGGVEYVTLRMGKHNSKSLIPCTGKNRINMFSYENLAKIRKSKNNEK